MKTDSNFPVVRYYPISADAATHAHLIWNVLIARAELERTITYGALADILEWKGSTALCHSLECIMKYCEGNNLPPLTALVVNREKGVPGNGFSSRHDFMVAIQKVYDFKWYRVIHPSIEELREAKKLG